MVGGRRTSRQFNAVDLVRVGSRRSAARAAAVGPRRNPGRWIDSSKAEGSRRDRGGASGGVSADRGIAVTTSE